MDHATGTSLIEEVLQERSVTAFDLDAERIRWRDHRLSIGVIRGARTAIAGFGSCSFDEPIGELAVLGLLASPATG
jgi:hypothetical protein